MPLDLFFFIVLLVGASGLICLAHLLRERITLGPVYAVAGIWALLLWQIRQLGWWVTWGDWQIDAALVGLIPPLLAGLILVHVMDGIRAARAYLLILLITGLIGWGFAEFRFELAQQVPIPYAFNFSTLSYVGVLAGIAIGSFIALLGYELLRQIMPVPLAMSLALLLGNVGYLVPSSLVEYGLAVGVANIQEQIPEFTLFSLAPAAMLLVYGLFASRQCRLMPPRSLQDVVSFWRSTESNLHESRQDVLKARQIISELQQLTNALEESKRINDYQVTHSPLGVIYTNLQGRIDKMNPAAERLTEINWASQNEIRADSLFDQLQGLQVLAHSKTSPTIKLAGTTSEKWCELTVMQLHDALGRFAGYHLLLKDVTAERQAKRIRRVEEKVRGIHQTGRVIVHDFSNLLLGMQGTLDSLRLAYEGSDAILFTNNLSTLKKGIKRGREMLQQLGAGEGLPRPKLENCELGELVQEAVNICRPAAQAKQIVITSLPSDEVQVNVDATQITRVFTNLLSNAVRVLPEYGGIEVAVINQSGGVTVNVRDNGPGLTLHQLESAFDPGFSSKGSGQGGLGLAISYLIIEAHGGHLELQQAKPHGLCARVWLPRLSAPAAASESGKVAALDRELMALIGRSGILLAFNDRQESERLAGELAALHPASLAEIYSGDELKAMLEEEAWQLLLTDHLPEAPGLAQTAVIQCDTAKHQAQVIQEAACPPRQARALLQQLGYACNSGATDE